MAEWIEQRILVREALEGTARRVEDALEPVFEELCREYDIENIAPGSTSTSPEQMYGGLPIDQEEAKKVIQAVALTLINQGASRYINKKRKELDVPIHVLS